MGYNLMIKINIIAIGDIKESYLKEGINEYLKRIKRYADINIYELKEHNPSSNNANDILIALEKDADEIKKKIKGFPICLDISGKSMDSIEFSNYLNKLSLSTSEISIIIGASNGLSDSIKSNCKDKISFSKMTFPHQLMRLILLEQLYRSFTIIHNIAYHK